MIRQGPLEGGERTAAPLIEDAAAHAEAGRHVGDRLATEEGEDRLETVFPGGAGRLWGGLHGSILLLSRVGHHGNFVESLECEILPAVPGGIAGLCRPIIQENTHECVLHLRRRNPTPLDTVITETLKLWRKHHLTYDQTRYVAKEVRRALAIARPPTRQRVIARLSRAEEERLIAQAYRMPGVRGLLIKTLFQTGARVSEFVHLQVPDVYFDEQMLLITHAKGGKQRYVPLLPGTHARTPDVSAGSHDGAVV